MQLFKGCVQWCWLLQLYQVKIDMPVSQSFQLAGIAQILGWRWWAEPWGAERFGPAMGSLPFQRSKCLDCCYASLMPFLCFWTSCSLNLSQFTDWCPSSAWRNTCMYTFKFFWLAMQGSKSNSPVVSASWSSCEGSPQLFQWELLQHTFTFTPTCSNHSGSAQYVWDLCSLQLEESGCVQYVYSSVYFIVLFRSMCVLNMKSYYIKKILMFSFH